VSLIDLVITIYTGDRSSFEVTKDEALVIWGQIDLVERAILCEFVGAAHFAKNFLADNMRRNVAIDFKLQRVKYPNPMSTKDDAQTSRLKMNPHQLSNLDAQALRAEKISSYVGHIILIYSPKSTDLAFALYSSRGDKIELYS
jgi:hypothetical protein